MFAASGTSIIYHAWPWMGNFMYDKYINIQDFPKSDTRGLILKNFVAYVKQA